MNKVLKQDIQDFVSSFELADELKSATFLITGATGLIGSTLIHCLLALDRRIRIIAPVRNKKKADVIFEDRSTKIDLIECDLLTFNYDSIGEVDYIIHCAAPTSSKFFVEHPVETFNTISQGTYLLLQYAKKHPIKGMVYLSSLEVYGSIYDDTESVTEDVQGYIDPLSVRSSYPMAKRATETLCCLYAAEYRVPVKIARLTQTTGAGIAKGDNRIIAQFARMAAEGKDIILHTKGRAARPYCYITDAISAILYILLKGNLGEAYNVANDMTYITARDMAEFLKDKMNPDVRIRFELNDNMGYAPESKLKLSSEKLEKLGWKSRYELVDIFENLIEYLREK